MPYLARITNTFFVALINRLGVRPPPPEGFELSNVVQPVSLVDVDVTLPVSLVSPLLDTPATAGIQAAPAATTVLADTGAQAAGNFTAYVMLSFLDPTQNVLVEIQRRNAANAANIWTQNVMSTPTGRYNEVHSLRIVLQAGERLRVVNITAGGVGSQFQASIWLTAS